MRIFLPLFIFLTSCVDLAQNCDDVRTGEFRIENEKIGSSILIRTDTTQEEIVEKLGIHIKYDLSWTNECVYVLYNGTLIEGDSQYEGKKSDTLFVEITQVNDNSYEFRSTSNFAKFEISGIAKRQ